MTPNTTRLLALTALAVAAGPAAAQPSFDKTVRPLLRAHCDRCHNDKKANGDLNLARFVKSADADADPGVWERSAARLRTHEMPPEGAKQPSIEDRNAFIAWAEGLKRRKKQKAACNELASDRTQHFYRGHVMSRRLTRDEYNRTVRDLTGVDVRPADRFPADGSGGEGFDTVGDSLFTSPIHVERYLAAAREVIDAALADSAARRRLLGDGPRDRGHAKTALAAFATRAFRRPVEKDETDRLLALYDRAAGRGDPFEAAVGLGLRSVLVSPQFLFLVEPEPAAEGVAPLAGYPLASRLSYFLWGTLPDDELLALAAAGKLNHDDALKRQVRRMLADRRSAGLAESFATQWLGLRGLGGATRPDPKLFPGFDDALAASMRAEAVAAVDHVVRGDRSVLELLDADYVFVDERLAKHYGIAGVTGPAVQKVKAPGRERGGVAVSAAVLTSTSYPTRTSPVLRGKWLLEEVLGAKVPPPPPGVGELPDGDEGPAAGLSLRQRLEKHRSNAECAACHARMDPLGFGLEVFDAVGRARTTDGGKPVDATGELPGGGKFTGPAGLKDVLLKRKDEFVRLLSKKMLGYALGRDLSRFDQCVVDECVKALRANDYRASALVETVALSYPFRHRYVKK